MKYLVTSAIVAATLSACSAVDGNETTFDSEAGSQITTGDFGRATMNNRLVQTGELDYTVNLARRFDAEIDTTINFAFNSAALDAEGRATLNSQADWIRQFPEVKFTVYGHTDLVGSAAYNRSLGLRRAQAAVNYLISQGIDRSRLAAVASFGETRPLVETESRERRNRRTVTGVSGFVANNPLVLNGRYAEVIVREYAPSATAISGGDRQ
ncbi:MAG: OmpA family protein [Yoonia sp.]|uniref:OmpA family protein n=1 Tax=Yoonia sp. TaxID=2212373 RepID=UPI003EFA594A